MTDHTRPYQYEDVLSGLIKYDDYIISGVLDMICKEHKWERSEVVEKLEYHYGGTFLISILDCVRNTSKWID